MASIIELMKHLNYPTNEEGVCSGIAHMAERARRIGDYDTFKERMSFLERMETNQLESLLSAAKKHSLLLRENPSVAQLTKEEEILLTIDAFFFQVWMHQNPSEIQTFLKLDASYLDQAETNAKVLLKADAPKLAQDKAYIAENFMYENDSQDKAKSPLNAPKKFFISDTKQADKIEFLQEFLEKIKSASEQDHLSLGVVISSGNHTIHIFYNNTTNSWVLTNHSDLSNTNSIEKISDQIGRIFSRNDVINLELSIFTDEPVEKVNSLWRELDAVSNNSLKSMIQNKATNSADSFGDTPLLIAAIHGLDSVTEELLKQPEIEVNKANNAKVNPLAAASQNGHYNVVKEFLKKNTDVNQTAALGLTALHLAVSKGHLDIVKELLKSSNIDVNKAFIDGSKQQNALFIAVSLGYNEIVAELLNHPNIKINVPTLRAPILFAAAANGHLDVLQTVLKHIPPKEVNVGGVLAVAVKNGHKAIVDELLKLADIDVNACRFNDYSGGMDKETPLIYAIERGDFDSIEKLLNHKNINISQPGYYDNTPLKAAINAGHLDLVKRILKFENQDVNFSTSTNLNRDTPLIIAISSNNKDMALELLKHPTIDVNKSGESVFGTINSRRNPLHLAVLHKQVEVVEELMKHKEIDLESVDEFKRNPIQIAIAAGNPQIISMLRQKYKELGIPEVKPITPPMEPTKPSVSTEVAIHSTIPRIESVKSVAPAKPHNVEIRQPENAPPDSLDPIVQNKYIMEPIIDFIETAGKKISAIMQANKRGMEYFQQCGGVISELVESQNALEKKINGGSIIDSTTVSHEFKYAVEALGKIVFLKGDLMRSKPPMNFIKEYGEVLKRVATRHESALNFTVQKNQTNLQAESYPEPSRNNYIMDPVINFIKSTCLKLETSGASPAVKKMFQSYLEEMQDNLNKCGDDILEPGAISNKLGVLISIANPVQNPNVFFTQPSSDMHLEFKKAMEEAEKRFMDTGNKLQM